MKHPAAKPRWTANQKLSLLSLGALALTYFAYLTAAPERLVGQFAAMTLLLCALAATVRRRPKEQLVPSS